MKFSEKWLREWVNPALSSEELAAQITMAGLEVDGVEPVAAEFTNVVVGEVVNCEKHPDADKLRITKVNVGAEELLDIVCGAPNCRQGLKVCVAMVGAVLPGNFKIKKSKLRGQASHGMLCSDSELGLADSHDGIKELPNDAPVGVDIREYLQLNDVAIDVDLTPNRADCLGIRGLAREVAVLNQMDVTAPVVVATDATIDDSVSIEIEAAADCPRYLGRVIRNVDLSKQSPLWMQEKLRRCGIRSIDPVVDVTNYVLLELGHPMHAFNLAAIDGGINVRRASDNEKLTLLDGNEVSLKSDTLVIADHQKPLAIAGIFGGLDSGVTSDTTDILLESAFFSPVSIMGKARQYGLHTDASHRYERGVDPELQHEAMHRATALLLDIVGGEVGPIVEAVHEKEVPQAKKIELRQARINKLIGIEIAASTVSEILSRSGFSIDVMDSGWSVSVPAYRFDISIEVDLIEEIARIYGYNNIPNVSPLASLKMPPRSETQLHVADFKSTLVARGYQEAITYSFVDPNLQSVLFPDQDVMVLPHPISTEMSVMRLSLLTGLLGAAVHNQKRQQSRVRLFEYGLSFVPNADEKLSCIQEPLLSGVICGSAFGEHWDLPSRAVDFYDVKGDVEALISMSTSVESADVSFVSQEHSALHPGQSAAIYVGDTQVGWLGSVHPSHVKAFDLNGKTFVFELFISKLMTKSLPEAQDLSKFPANKRDLAIVVDDAVPAENVLNFIQKVGGNQLVDLKLFDVYYGQGVKTGAKSLAVSLTLQDSGRTLEEKEIADTIDTVVSALQKEFGASLRE